MSFFLLVFSEQKLKKKLQHSEEEEEEEEGGDNSVIRCPCEDNVDKGMMIQCETCLVWQHSVCVGIREDKSVPAHYFCEICLPRNFRCSCGENTAKGKLIECPGCSTWQHIRCLGRIVKGAAKNYRCPNCDPESYTPDKLKKKLPKKQVALLLP